VKATPKKNNQIREPLESDFFSDRIWEESWTYIKTVVDVVREPVLILNKDLCVMAANESFYRTFQVDQKHTEGTLVYELGNGQWDIPSLRRLLEDILPNNTFFKGYEVAHDFPTIGRKVIILNARQIHRNDGKNKFPPIIMLAMEDVTEMMNVADSLARHTNEFEVKMGTRLEEQEVMIKRLEHEMRVLNQKK
jgi:nitrogen-specific signal transduction histidine kinase